MEWRLENLLTCMLIIFAIDEIIVLNIYKWRLKCLKNYLVNLHSKQVET